MAYSNPLLWFKASNIYEIHDSVVSLLGWAQLGMFTCLLGPLRADLGWPQQDGLISTWDDLSPSCKQEGCSLLGTAKFLLHSLSQSKSQGQPRLNKWGYTLHYMMGGAANSHCKYVDIGRDEGPCPPCNQPVTVSTYYVLDHLVLTRFRTGVNMVFCKRPDIKYFQLYEPHSVFLSYSVLPL